MSAHDSWAPNGAGVTVLHNSIKLDVVLRGSHSCSAIVFLELRCLNKSAIPEALAFASQVGAIPAVLKFYPQAT